MKKYITKSELRDGDIIIFEDTAELALPSLGVRITRTGGFNTFDTLKEDMRYNINTIAKVTQRVLRPNHGRHFYSPSWYNKTTIQKILKEEYSEDYEIFYPAFLKPKPAHTIEYNNVFQETYTDPKSLLKVMEDILLSNNNSYQVNIQVVKNDTES